MARTAIFIGPGYLARLSLSGRNSEGNLEMFLVSSVRCTQKSQVLVQYLETGPLSATDNTNLLVRDRNSKYGTDQANPNSGSLGDAK